MKNMTETKICAFEESLRENEKAEATIQKYGTILRKLMGYLGEKEITKIRLMAYRTAKEKGIRYGRPLSPLPENFTAVYQRWEAGEITGVEAAKECGMPLSSFRYRAKQREEEERK